MEGSNIVKNIWNFILLLVGAFLVVHFAAIFGPFLLIIYPVLILLNPTNEPCIFCILRGYNNTCSIRRIFKVKKPFHIFLIDSILLILITLLSIASLSFEKKLLEKSDIVVPTKKTATVDVPDYANYRINEVSMIPVKVSGLKTPINVVQADLNYDPLLIEVQDVIVGESFANIFIQKDIRNDLGFTRITGGIPNPGFTGEEGVFAKVLIRCKNSGAGKISVLPTSKVLANDGKGTDVLAEFSDHSFYISKEALSLPELEAQDEFLQTQVLGVSSNKYELYKENITEGFEFSNLENNVERLGFIDIAHSYMELVTSTFNNIF